VVNAVNAIYINSNFDPGITVQLVGQVTMRDGDPWDRPAAPAPENGKDTEVSVDSYLEIFHVWRSKSGQKVSTVPEQLVPTHDNSHLFSGLDFEDSVLGYAGVGSMCNFAISGGINQVASPAAGARLSTYAATVAHELGHNFGMRHDSSGNDCPGKGNIMNAILTSDFPTQFSDCSKAYYTSR
jgi:hypothetical protein